MALSKEQLRLLEFLGKKRSLAMEYPDYLDFYTAQMTGILDWSHARKEAEGYCTWMDSRGEDMEEEHRLIREEGVVDFSDFRIQTVKALERKGFLTLEEVKVGRCTTSYTVRLSRGFYEWLEER